MRTCCAGSFAALATFGLRGATLFFVGAGAVVVIASAGFCRTAGDGLVFFAFAGFCRVAGDWQSGGNAGAGADRKRGVWGGDASNLGSLGLVA